MTTPSLSAIQPMGTAAVDSTRKETRANLDKAAAQFESLFINMMLKEARKASLGDGMFDNDATKTFRDMQDAKFAEEMGKRGTLGIARAVAQFLGRGQKLEKSEAATDGAAAATEQPR